MTKYEIYVQLRDARHLTDAQVSEMSGVSRSTFSDWKNGRFEPKEKKLKMLADFFHVPYTVFYGSLDTPNYYFDKKTADLAQKIYDNQDLLMLMNASAKMPPKTLTALRKFVEDIAERDSDESA